MKKMTPVEVKLLAPSPWVEQGNQDSALKTKLQNLKFSPSTPLPPTGFHYLFPVSASVLGGVLAPCQSSCLPLSLSHQHCLLPSAAGAAGNRQQRGPHSYLRAGYYHRGANKIQKNTDHIGYPVTHREGRKKWEMEKMIHSQSVSNLGTSQYHHYHQVKDGSACYLPGKVLLGI